MIISWNEQKKEREINARVTLVVKGWSGPSLSRASFMTSLYRRSHCSTAHVSNTSASCSCFSSFSSIHWVKARLGEYFSKSTTYSQKRGGGRRKSHSPFLRWVQHCASTKRVFGCLGKHIRNWGGTSYNKMMWGGSGGRLSKSQSPFLW